MGSWDGALRLLAAAVPQDGPSVVVIDELPYLAASVPAFEGTLQKAFDRHLSRRPMLLSDRRSAADLRRVARRVELGAVPG